MARMGRPPTPAREQVTTIRLKKKHVEMLDKVIRERSERDMQWVVRTGPELKIPGTEVTLTTYRIEDIDYSSERRRLLAKLIEQTLTTEALYPTEVRPLVPPGPYSNVQITGISTWERQETLRLTESAPIPVKLVLEDNKLHRMRRELPLEEYLKRVQTATAPRAGDDVGTRPDVPKGGLMTLEEAGAVTTEDDETTP